jgi:hypothetical protein
MLPGRLACYERLTEFDAFILKEENPRLTEFVSDLHGVWESRAILRHLRVLAGIPICYGEGIERPSVRCTTGQHDTCPETFR